MNFIIYQLVLFVIDGANHILCAGGRGGAIAAKGGSRSFGPNISNANDDSGSLSVILVVILPVAQMFAVLVLIILVRFCYRNMCRKERKRKLSATSSSTYASGNLRGLSRVSPLPIAHAATIANQFITMPSLMHNDGSKPIQTDKRHSNASDQSKSVITSLPPNERLLVANPDDHHYPTSPPTRLLLSSAALSSNTQLTGCSSHMFPCCGGSRNVSQHPSSSSHSSQGQSSQHGKFHPSIPIPPQARLPSTHKNASSRHHGSHCYHCPLITTICDVHSSNTTASTASNSNTFNGSGNNYNSATANNADRRQSRDEFDYYNDSDDEEPERDRGLDGPNPFQSELKDHLGPEDIADVALDEYGPFDCPQPFNSGLSQQSLPAQANMRTNSCPNPNPASFSGSSPAYSRPFFCLHHQTPNLKPHPRPALSTSSPMPVNCRHTY